MATVAEMSSGIKDRLETISGLRAFEYPPENINPPVAFVVLDEADFNVAMQRGTDTYTFSVYVFTGSQIDRAGYKALTAYADPTGSGSIRSAIWNATARSAGTSVLGLDNTDANVAGFRFLNVEEVQQFSAWGGVFSIRVVTKGS